MFQIVKIYKNMLKLAIFFPDFSEFHKNPISKYLRLGTVLAMFIFFGHLGLDVLTKSVLDKDKAVYTAESVACDRAGAVMQKLPKKRQKKIRYRPTDGPTDGPTQLGME